MQGKRIYADDEGHLRFSAPGEYGKDIHGKWHASVPVKPLLTGNLSGHDVTEHEDGTITVSPSILVTKWDGQQWHGYLEHGVWRDA